MEESSAKRAALGPGDPAMPVSSDFITFLPDEVAHEILARMPIRDAVRTAALSRAWRDRWRFMPSLAFDDRCTCPLRLPPWNVLEWKRRLDLACPVDHVLALHAGAHLRNFSVSSSHTLGRDLFRWVAYLRVRGVKSILLDFTGGARQKLPSAVFLCASLETLVLRNCSFHLPPCFDGLPSLWRLTLQNACAGKGELQRLLERLPQLQVLGLDGVEVEGRLHIRQRGLVSLSVTGMNTDLSLEDAGRLTWARIGVSPVNNGENACNLIQLLRGLPSLATLEVVMKSLQVLSASASKVEPRRWAYTSLRSLHLDIDFTSSAEVVEALSLAFESVNLTKLSATARSDDVAPTPLLNLSALRYGQGFLFRRLTEVDVRGINAGHGLVFGFIRAILVGSPELRKMKVYMASASDAAGRLNACSTLLRFPRASPRAEVFFYCYP